MNDPRLKKLGHVLVNYSVELKPGQLVRIQGPFVAAPLMRELFAAALEAGANPYIRIGGDDALDETYFKTASDEQLRFISDVDRHEIERIDARMHIWAHTNTRALTSVDPKRLALRSEATRPLFDRFLERAASKELRWNGTAYPTDADAQEADMSLSEWADFIFRAGMLDRADPIGEWRRVEQEQQRIATFLNGQDALRLRGKDIDLAVVTKGRRWENAAGHENFPDGEIFTGPVEDSVNGWVRFSFPTIYSARVVEGVELTLEQGRVVKARAAKGEDFLLSMLDLDEGARRVGEFAFGLNYDITRFTKNILFDEKIGGTVHMALGGGYPETGSRNKSGLHWDMICDLREDGEVTAGGEVIYREGRFLI